jgi:hypothetical protein
MVLRPHTKLGRIAAQLERTTLRGHQKRGDLVERKNPAPDDPFDTDGAIEQDATHEREPWLSPPYPGAVSW